MALACSAILMFVQDDLIPLWLAGKVNRPFVVKEEER